MSLRHLNQDFCRKIIFVTEKLFDTCELPHVFVRKYVIALVVILGLIGSSLNLDFTSEDKLSRDGKAFSLFQVVKFQNGPCQSATRNGTCYTVTLGCGETTTDNCTYLSRTPDPGLNDCQYTICKASNNVCRIRFDFMAFDLASPVLGLTTTVATDAAISTNGGAIGDCLADKFSITSPGNVAPPQICGFNTGQHMIVDASEKCHVASFNLERTSSTYDIKVTQYLCGDEMAGPDGCLQYFVGNTGTVASFNFPTQASIVPPETTHLSNQCYTMCFRQEQGKCAICYQAVDVAGQGSFGLSKTVTATVTGENNNDCFMDYLMIPGALRDSGVVANNRMFVVGNIPDGRDFNNRICGRFFHLASIRANRVDNTESICTSQRPFQITFKTDDTELTLAAVNMPEMNEQSGSPGGITGFNLNWALQDC
ncbi:hypothetical protein TCAL_01452 [Tigriopus californicus]|uniref:CUB domain-containing protein n=1 Tax=Tigriopus californicus TaxID=6832 RepID=A0A553N7C4_TIGCA|nr:hypothetical protein TCAL_01452 [Tigriopus californicus]